MFNKKHSEIKIISAEIRDIRFPTSKDLDGSDAMNESPDYSSASIVLFTNNPNLKGYGMKRIYGFLSERYLSYWFQKNTNVVELPIVFKDISDYKALLVLQN